MYTLVSAPVLGFDLARRDGGHQVAGILRRALALTWEELPLVAGQHRDDPASDAAWLAIGGIRQTAVRNIRVRQAGPGNIRGHQAGPGDIRGHQAGPGDIRGHQAGPGDIRGHQVGPGDQQSDRSGPGEIFLPRQGKREPSTGPTPEPTETDLKVLLAELTTAPIGSLDGLLRCVRSDVLDWTWLSPEATSAPLSPEATSAPLSPEATSAPPPRPPAASKELVVQGELASRAAAVICDAVAAAYTGPALAPEHRRRLGAPWWQALRQLPEPAPSTGVSAEVDSFLLAASRLSTRQLGALRAVSASNASGRGWARAVHDASWAVHLSGRTRTAAAVQFSLVEAVHDGGLSHSDAASGNWNLLSGAVQALTVADLLDTAACEQLIDPVRAALFTG